MRGFSDPPLFKYDPFPMVIELKTPFQLLSLISAPFSHYPENHLFSCMHQICHFRPFALDTQKPHIPNISKALATLFYRTFGT